MRKIYLILFALLPIASILAQPCTPDPNFNSAGISPNKLPDGIVDVAYNETITLVVPSDTVVVYNGTPYNARIDSARVLSINGYPTGFSYQGNKPSLTWNGGEKGCAKLTGTANSTQTGSYVIWVTVQTWFKIVGLSQQFEQIDSSAIDFKVTQANSINKYQIKKQISVYPNPVANQLNVNLTTYSDAITAKIYDILGNSINTEKVGENNLAFNTSNLKKGVYFIELTDGKNTYISKFIKQ